MFCSAETSILDCAAFMSVPGAPATYGVAASARTDNLDFVETGAKKRGEALSLGWDFPSFRRVGDWSGFPDNGDSTEEYLGLVRQDDGVESSKRVSEFH